MDKCSTSPCSMCGPWWRLPLLLALVLGAVWLGRGIRQTQRPSEGSASKAGVRTGQTVSLLIDFGDGRRQEHEAIAWREGMTVRDVLLAAFDSSGGTKFAQQGSGASAFLTEIDGIENEGPGGRNWTYSVNGELADRSFAIYPLRAGDQVLWTFAARQ